MAGFQDIFNHGGAHLAETDKTDVHLSLHASKELKVEHSHATSAGSTPRDTVPY
jgi:hypothetical protein